SGESQIVRRLRRWLFHRLRSFWLSGSGDNGGDAGLEDGASARKSRTGSRAIAPSDGSGPGGNGWDGDGVGGCDSERDMVRGG
ncbi:hypothetical protein E4U56_003802, partial [Claviceps arundinis]